MTNESVRRWLEALSQSLNPETGEVLSQDSAYAVLTNPETKEALNYALGAIDLQAVQSHSYSSHKKEPFTLTDEEKNRIQALPGVPLNVSQISGMINSVLPEGRPKMRPNKINQWLTKKGILEDDVFDGKTHHKLTDYGVQLGAHGMKVPSRYGGEYWNNVYPVRIQADIVNHAEEIMNS